MGCDGGLFLSNGNFLVFFVFCIINRFGDVKRVSDVHNFHKKFSVTFMFLRTA